MSDLDDDDGIDRSLLDAARAGLEPSAAQRKKLRRAVMAAIGTSAVTTGTAAGAQAAASATGAATAAGTATGGVATAAGLGLGAKIVIGTIALASVVGVVAVGRRSTSHDDPAPSAATTSIADAPPIAAAPERQESPLAAATPEPSAEVEAIDAPAPELEPAPELAAAPRPALATTRPGPSVLGRAPSTRPMPAPSPAPTFVAASESDTVPATPATAEEDPVRVETRLLARARAAIARHDGAAALAILDEHARLFPDGQLREERLANRVSALCALGERERAHAEATSFLAAHPGSVQVGAVRAADCWSDARELGTP